MVRRHGHGAADRERKCKGGDKEHREVSVIREEGVAEGPGLFPAGTLINASGLL